MMRRTHSYSRHALAAAELLGLEIARARRERRWKLVELAERAGISTITLRSVERGAPTVAVGTVLEVATLLGVPLFGHDPAQLPSLLAGRRDQLALLPARVREPTTPVRDEF